MPKPKPKLVNEETEDQEELEEIEEEIKGMNYDHILSEYTGTDFEYLSLLYKLENGKRVFLSQYDNEIPHPVHELQNKFGGGTFRIYIKDCSTGKLVKSADAHISPPIKKIDPANNPQSRADLLQELKTMSEIIGNNNQPQSGNNDILMELMKMQNKQSEKFMEMQVKAEQRMTDLIMQIQNKKTDISDYIDVFSKLNELRENTDPTSPIEKIISNPMVQPLIGSLASKFVASDMQGQNNPALPAPDPAPKQSVNDLINIIRSSPEGSKFLDSVNEKNVDKKIEHLYNKNKESLTQEDATNIILTVLKNNLQNKPKELTNE